MSEQSKLGHYPASRKCAASYAKAQLWSASTRTVTCSKCAEGFELAGGKQG
jgi:hypothetical protein